MYYKLLSLLNPLLIADFIWGTTSSNSLAARNFTACCSGCVSMASDDIRRWNTRRLLAHEGDIASEGAIKCNNLLVNAQPANQHLIWLCVGRQTTLWMFASKRVIATVTQRPKRWPIVSRFDLFVKISCGLYLLRHRGCACTHRSIVMRFNS